MAKPDKIIKKLSEALHTAKSSLTAAEDWLRFLAGEHDIELDSIKEKAQKNNSKEVIGIEGDAKVIEGIFDGQNMVTSDGQEYPVPANYASKSKLIEGDNLKLMIQSNGAFVYKQIELVPRKLITGRLILDGNQYEVLTDKKSYKVLYASVTFFRAKVGDHLTLIVPEDETASWSAIENIIPEKTETPLISKKDD